MCILSANSATDGWDDDKVAEFNLMMSKVARLVGSPVDTLKGALQNLHRL